MFRIKVYNKLMLSGFISIFHKLMMEIAHGFDNSKTQTIVDSAFDKEIHLYRDKPRA